MPLSFIELSTKNLRSNVQFFRDTLSPQTKIAAVVKANAYGHGQNEVAQIIEKQVDYFQVDDLQELELLRKVSHKPTFVFGYVAKDELARAAALDGILCIYDTERLHLLNAIGDTMQKKIKIHIKIDAHLGRQGLLLEEVTPFLAAVKKCPHILLDGAYAHFANIEDTTDFSHAQKQIDTYHIAVKIIKENGFANIQTHIAATSGILAYEKEKGLHTVARLGIGIYGLWPSAALQQSNKITPVLRWVTRVAQIKTLPAGHSIGYGLTYITKKPTKIAVIPQGYSDGYDRGFSNKGEVLIRATRCPVLGRVAMNMFVVDVSHLDDAEQEDEVVLLGTQGKEEITAEEMAAKIDTINYEVTTRISPLLKRKVLE